MITKEITVFDVHSINEGDVVFVKVNDEYKKALIEKTEERYLRFVYINDAGTTNSKMILIDEYLEDKTLIRPAHCYIK